MPLAAAFRALSTPLLRSAALSATRGLLNVHAPLACRALATSRAAMVKVVPASAVAAPYTAEIKNVLAKEASPELAEDGLPVDAPRMVAFLANEDEAARRYAEWTGKTCRDIGLRFELRQVTRTQLEEAIIEANEDDGVNGIMVYYPVFGDAMDQYLQNIVDPAKDVEGLCHTYRFYMYHNIRHLDEAKTQRCIIPCTPLAIVKFLEHMGIYNSKLPYGDRLHGRTVTVINRSEVVGRPLAALLANDGAHVYSADVNGLLELNRGQGLHLKRYLTNECSLTLEEALARSDIVIGGVPAKAYKIPTAQLREGVVAINLSSVANFEDDITSKASFFVSSVGKVTTVMLERNLMRLWQYQRKARAEAEVKETDAEADAVAEEEQAAKAYA